MHWFVWLHCRSCDLLCIGLCCCSGDIIPTGAHTASLSHIFSWERRCLLSWHSVSPGAVCLTVCPASVWAWHCCTPLTRAPLQGPVYGHGTVAHPLPRALLQGPVYGHGTVAHPLPRALLQGPVYGHGTVAHPLPAPGASNAISVRVLLSSGQCTNRTVYPPQDNALTGLCIPLQDNALTGLCIPLQDSALTGLCIPLQDSTLTGLCIPLQDSTLTGLCTPLRTVH
jgi:hypothetical protein